MHPRPSCPVCAPISRLWLASRPAEKRRSQAALQSAVSSYLASFSQLCFCVKTVDSAHKQFTLFHSGSRPKRKRSLWAWAPTQSKLHFWLWTHYWLFFESARAVLAQAVAQRLGVLASSTAPVGNMIYLLVGFLPRYQDWILTTPQDSHECELMLLKEWSIRSIFFNLYLAWKAWLRCSRPSVK